MLTQVNTIMAETGIHHVYIASDMRPMDKEARLKAFLDALRPGTEHIVSANSFELDLVVLGLSQQFVGNCISSFTAFVKRARDVLHLPSAFWGWQNTTPAGAV